MKTAILVCSLLSTSAFVPVEGYAPPQDGPTPDGSGETPSKSVRVSPGVQAKALIKIVRPDYPAEAKARRIQGKVVFEAVIGKDGKVKSLKTKSGPRELVQAAYDAVIRWEYRPTLLNGEPVEVLTEIDVNYSIL